jgi:integrase
MKVVEPLRDMDQLNRCFEIARAHDKGRSEKEPSWELLLVVGFNTSLRISDIVRFRVKDLRGQEYARTVAQKTGKDTRILINNAARREINRLTAGRRAEEYLLQSRQKDRRMHTHKPITRQRAWQIINAICREAGIKDRIGCHTLRKTFGYHYYKMTGDIVSLQRILGHNSQRDTLVYIGVIQDEIDESLKKFRLVGLR